MLCSLSLKFCSLDIPFRFTIFRFRASLSEFGFKIGSVVVGCTVGTEGEDAGLVVSFLKRRRSRTVGLAHREPFPGK